MLSSESRQECLKLAQNTFGIKQYKAKILMTRTDVSLLDQVMDKAWVWLERCPEREFSEARPHQLIASACSRMQSFEPGLNEARV